MKCRIRAFGIARDIIGQSVFDYEMENIVSIGDLKQSLFKKYPRLQALNSMFIAVNSEYADENVVLNEQDEIALIPPVSGG